MGLGITRKMPCKICGKPVQVDFTRRLKNAFCSQECQREFNRRRQREYIKRKREKGKASELQVVKPVAAKKKNQIKRQIPKHKEKPLTKEERDAREKEILKSLRQVESPVTVFKIENIKAFESGGTGTYDGLVFDRVEEG
jgi:predicted nucleic acid-binding Zn ribbon protein